jgi:excisionase family DNA binding protein
MRKKNESTDYSLISQGPFVTDRLEKGAGSLMSAEAGDRLLRVDEVATLLGISVGGLYHLVSQKRVPVVRISSRCIRFSRRALSDWVVSRTQPPDPIED